jgi:GT2 family glycosyltransferase
MARLKRMREMNETDEPLVPTVSVITPYYNGADYIGPTIESVRAQTLTAWEHVIVDDGSPGDVIRVLQPYLEEPRVRFIRQPHGGQAKARNHGARICSPLSRYFLFLDQDDVLESPMLQTLVAYLDNHLDVGMVFCDALIIDAHGAPGREYPNVPVERWAIRGRRAVLLPCGEADTPLESFLLHADVNPAVVVLRRSVFEEVGGFDEEFQGWGEDLDLWVRIALRSHAHYIPERLVRYRIHDASASFAPELAAARSDADRRFETKWLECRGLSEEERRRVQAALRFIDERLWPHRFFMWGREALSRGRPIEAVAQWLRGVRRFARSRARRWLREVRHSSGRPVG